jgi:hypothetical protein
VGDVFQVSREDLACLVLQVNVDLSSQTIVFVFTGEKVLLKSVEYLLNGFRGLGQHGLARRAQLQLTGFFYEMQIS